MENDICILINDKINKQAFVACEILFSWAFMGSATNFNVATTLSRKNVSVSNCQKMDN